MTLTEALLPEFDQEMAKTRTTLERVPDDKFKWKPHEKSMPFGELANHVANIPTWARTILDAESFDFAASDANQETREMGRTAERVLAIFDRNVAAVRERLSRAGDEELVQIWRLLKGGEEIMSGPRISVFRSFILSHTIHHRAQLGVYLRLNDLPVPATYGPSADEGQM